jgi:polyketide biosynthesis acyl carrier protein
MNYDEIFQLVKKNIVTVLPYLAGKEIPIEKSLKDLGANSIDRAEVVTLSIEDLGIKIPMVEFGKVNNIKGMVDILHEKKKAAMG